MVKINSRIVNQKKNESFINLKQLNVDNFELTQVQKYSQDAFSTVSESINNLAKQSLILSKTKNQDLNFSSVKSQYFVFDEVIYGDETFLQNDKNTILCPIDGVIYLNLTIFFSINVVDVVRIYLQLDKSNISPLTGVPTNVDYALVSLQGSTSLLSTTASYSLVVSKGQKLKLIFYSNAANGTISYEKPTKTQLTMRW